MRYIASVFGLLIAVAAMLCLLLLDPLGFDPGEMATVPSMFGFVAFCVLTGLLLGYIADVLVLALAALVLRGPTAIGWVSPSEFRGNLKHWLAYEWDFFGKGGRHEGVRFLGFEVAIRGSL